jgi:outer membrane protein TolC
VFAALSFDDPLLLRFVESHLPPDESDRPPAAWGFDALTLAALYLHPSLEAARARVQLADAQRVTAGERPNPTLDTVSQYNASSSDISAWILGTVVNLTLETAGKRGDRIARARHSAEAARWDLASAAWDVRRRLRAAMVELYAAQRNAQLLSEQLSQQEALVRLLESERDAGAVAGAQVMRESIALNRGSLAVQGAREQVLTARAALAEAVGMPVAALDAIDLSFDELERVPEPPDDDDLRRRALLNRPDLLSSLAAYAATESALALEIARQFPDISLGPGYEFDQGASKWTLGLSLPLPVFHRNQGPIAEAEAHRREAAAQFLELQASITNHLGLAAARLAARLELDRRAGKLVAELERQEALTDSMHDAGELALGDVLAARLERIAGELALLDAHTELYRAVGEVEDAMQTKLTLSPALLRIDEAATWATEPR